MPRIVIPPPPTKSDFNAFESPPVIENEDDAKSIELNINNSSHRHHRRHHHQQQQQQQRSYSHYSRRQEFYNHEMYGSLREGGSVSLFSKECIGLVAATFSSLLSYSALQGALRPLISTQLNLTSQENVAVRRLVELPMALSVFIGLISDSFPMYGTRRKSYMVLGLIVNAVGVLALAALSAHFETLDSKERNSALVVTAIFFITVASMGCIITYLCVHTRTIELSQQESLRKRGIVQAQYLIVRRLTSFASGCFVYVCVGSNMSTPNWLMSNSMLLLAFICVLPLPFILKYWHEETYSLSTPLKTRGQIFWKIMQQKAVWRTLSFIGFFTLFLSISFYDSEDVIQEWSGVGWVNSLVLRSIQDSVALIVIIIWRYVFINRPWLLFFALGPIFQIFPMLLASILISMDILRDKYFYRVMLTSSYIQIGVMVFTNIVPLTEIVQEGSEGVTVGLVLTIQRLISVFVNTSAVGVFRGDHFYDPSEVADDTSHVRWQVLVSLLINYGINAVSFFGLFFLPLQKLDAQQLRMYGGFTKIASTAIILFSLAFFLYSLAINAMTFVPAWSCYQIAGGDGC